jgi:tRNA (pseudouridine54-N1)-methyltransferase
MRRFVIVGSAASSSPNFLLQDIPSTSGRLDVLVRALRAALLVSHGVRRDARVYLVLQGDPDAVVTLRVDGAAAKYLRPDERSLATLIKKTLALAASQATSSFAVLKPGVAAARGGIEVVLPELGGSALCLLEETGADLRGHAFVGDDLTFFAGDHTGLPAPLRALLIARGASVLSVGPQSLHTEDALAVVHNELDRRAGDARRCDA